MTALTVLQNMKTTDIVTIGSEINMIAADSSKAGFSQGQVVTVQELLEGLLISSGNDAAYVLAKAAGEAILKDNIANEGKTFTAAQCVERFVYEMNKNVRDMELENTHFMSRMAMMRQTSTHQLATCLRLQLKHTTTKQFVRFAEHSLKSPAH